MDIIFGYTLNSDHKRRLAFLVKHSLIPEKKRN